jgi:glycosyltransferase involved in cell wall biosynthesis
MASSSSIQGRLGLQQRVLPSYRRPFFDALASACTRGLSLFAGQPAPDEGIQTTQQLDVAQYTQAHNLHVGKINSPFYLCWQAGLLRWLEAEQPDVLIVEANPRYLSTRLACSWMRRHHRPVIGWGLGAPAPAGAMGAVRKSGRERFLSQFDALIAYSSKGAQEYRQGGFPSERIFVASNAVVPPPASPPPAHPAVFKGRPVVLFIGRLQLRKRIDNLLHACAALPADLQPEVWVVGDGPALADFQALAARIYPLAKFPGALRGAELEPYFARADVFVLPGTGGLAVQEAMAHALPVIVAEGDGTQDDLVRPENGWRLPPDDLGALTQTLQRALSDPARLRQMGDEAYRIVRDEVNIDQMVAVFAQAVASVSSSQPQNPLSA